MGAVAAASAALRIGPEVEIGGWAAAAAHFDRCVTLAPGDVRLRFAVGAWANAGDRRRARALLDDGMRRGLPLEMMLDPAAGGAAR